MHPITCCVESVS